MELKRYKKKADALIKDPGKLKRFSEGAKNWLVRFKDIPFAGNTAQDLMDMIDLVNDYADGKYTAIPKRFLAAILGALLYVISPIDILPGFLDDILIVSIIMDKGVGAELKKYNEWRNTNDAGTDKEI